MFSPSSTKLDLAQARILAVVAAISLITGVFGKITIAVAQEKAPPLIDSGKLRSQFLGKWGVPTSKDSSSNNRRMGYSEGIHYIDVSGNLRISTHRYDLRGLGIFKRPATLTKSQNNIDIPVGSLVGWDETPG